MKLITVLLTLSVVCANNLHMALEKTWEGIKKRNIDAYQISCVHRPYSETPNDCVSEGIGYGMILALYSNDQKYFNLIWEAAEQYMWNGQNYDWHIDIYGNKVDVGAATDAEEDIAFALISADNLVKQNLWQQHNNPTYGERAQNILNSMWDLRMISYGKNVAPGASWGGDNFVNPSYFSPGWYRIFAKFDNQQHDWNTVINNCYTTLLNNVGVNNGLVPDWISPTGQYYDGSFGYNTYGNGKYLFKDAIRTLWRISTDYVWHGEPRALQFLNNSYNFIINKGGAKASNFYTMDGDLLPTGDIWYFDDNKKWRHRREHSHLTVGMWSTVAVAVGKNTTQFTIELLKFYENSTYWGLTKSSTHEDIYHNEMYFDQFLAWFGAAMLANIWHPY
jgi:endo-1,4-beta-D-glucanase Y